MDKQILCEHPVCILHPNARVMIATAKYISRPKCGPMEIDDFTRRLVLYDWDEWSRWYRRLPYRDFASKSYLENVGVVDDNGEFKCLYLWVPCGKCDLCAYRKTKELAFRCTCETYTNNYIPYFVTLTYNDACLPDEGVCKKDVQNFIKRLREYFRRRGLADNIRYVITAEYTPKEGRPHYHALFWNLPDFSLHDMLRCLEKMWKCGFVYVKRNPNKGPGYAIKYAFKGCKVPEGKNDVFYLSSRRPGIGADYADSLVQYLREHPDQLKVSCYDICTRRVVSCPIPEFFKRRAFKTTCLLVPQITRKAFEAFCQLCAIRNGYAKFLFGDKDDNPLTFWKCKHEDEVLGRLGVLFPYVDKDSMPKILKVFKMDCVHDRYVRFIELLADCEELCNKLMDMPVGNLDDIPKFAAIKEARKIALDSLVLPSIDVEMYAQNVKLYKKSLLSRQKY